jgi:hypothetical protein
MLRMEVPEVDDANISRHSAAVRRFEDDGSLQNKYVNIKIDLNGFAMRALDFDEWRAER